MIDRLCRKNSKRLGFSLYFTGIPCIKGHTDFRRTDTGRCIKCTSLERNTEEAKERQRIYHKTNWSKILPVKQKYAKENKVEIAEYQAQYYQENKNKCDEHSKKYRHTDKGRKAGRIKANKRRAILRNALPKWADLEKIKEIYLNCPDGYEVDHEIPLKGIDRLTKQHVVCGLHVEYNLQYMKKGDNQKKWSWV